MKRLVSILFFILATIITAWFIYTGEKFYASKYEMIVSCSIAGAKWLLQVVAALLLMKEKPWQFIYGISRVCLAGSLALIPFCLLSSVHSDPRWFFGSLIFSVLVMIPLYLSAVIKSGQKPVWFFAWVACLALAIILQLTIVFHYNA